MRFCWLPRPRSAMAIVSWMSAPGSGRRGWLWHFAAGRHGGPARSRCGGGEAGPRKLRSQRARRRSPGAGGGPVRQAACVRRPSVRERVAGGQQSALLPARRGPGFARSGTGLGPHPRLEDSRRLGTGHVGAAGAQRTLRRDPSAGGFAGFAGGMRRAARRLGGQTRPGAPRRRCRADPARGHQGEPRPPADRAGLRVCTRPTGASRPKPRRFTEARPSWRCRAAGLVPAAAGKPLRQQARRA